MSSRVLPVDGWIAPAGLRDHVHPLEFLLVALMCQKICLDFHLQERVSFPHTQDDKRERWNPSFFMCFNIYIKYTFQSTAISGITFLLKEM